MKRQHLAPLQLHVTTNCHPRVFSSNDSIFTDTVQSNPFGLQSYFRWFGPNPKSF